MNKLTLSLALLLTASQSFANVGIFADQVPTILFTHEGNMQDATKLLNTINNSMVYSAVTTKIRNGSGTKFLARDWQSKVNEGSDLAKPKDTQQIADYILRQLSLYDLYFMRSLKDQKIQNLKLGIHLFPTNSEMSAGLKGVGDEALSYLFKNLMGPFAPVGSSTLKIENPAILKNEAMVQNIRNAQLASAAKRYPANESFNSSGDWAAKAAWLLFSNLPLTISSTFEVKNTQGFAQTTFLMPALGIPQVNRPQGQQYWTLDDVKMGPMWFSSNPKTLEKGAIKMEPIESDVAIIDEIRFFPDYANRRYGQAAQLETLAQKDKLVKQEREFAEKSKSRVLKVDFIKNFENTHLMEVALTFGYLPKFESKNALATNVDLVRNFEDVRKAANDYEFAEDRKKVKTDARKQWLDLAADSDLALIAKGDFKLNSYVFPKAIRDNVEKYGIREYLNKLMAMLELRIVFHKLHLVMDRMKDDDKNPMYPAMQQNKANLNFFLTEDIGFKVRNTTLDLNRSVITVRVNIKQEKIDEFTSYYNQLAAPVQSLVAAHLCDLFNMVESDSMNIPGVWGKVFKEEKTLIGKGLKYSTCDASFASYGDFKRNFIANFVSKQIMQAAGGAIKDSVDYQAEQADPQFNKLLEDVAYKVLNTIQASSFNLDRILNTTAKN